MRTHLTFSQTASILQAATLAGAVARHPGHHRRSPPLPDISGGGHWHFFSVYSPFATYLALIFIDIKYFFV